MRPTRQALVMVAFAAVMGGTLVAQVGRPPNQSIDPFIGTWMLNLGKSTFENIAAPKSVIRTVDYERDGMILVTAHTTNPAGAMTFVHYLFTLDGKEHQEMTRAAPSADRTPTYVSAAKVNDRALKLVFTSGGKVTISHEWTVSDDGKTLTAKRTASNAQGQRVYSVQVFDRQP